MVSGLQPVPRTARTVSFPGTMAAAAALGALAMQAPAFAGPCLNQAFGSPVTCNAADFGVSFIGYLGD
jgi:hypothetical protein